MSEKFKGILCIFALYILAQITLPLLVRQVFADEHGRTKNGDRKYETYKKNHQNWNYEDERLDGKEEKNEITGQTTAWILLLANLSVVLSLSLKLIIRKTSISKDKINFLKKVNNFQRHYMMRFHYIVNPVALLVATIHFSLSSCRNSPLPELGLLCLVAMVILGLTIKFRLPFKRVQQIAYHLHTSYAAISVTTLLIVVGHMSV